MPLTLRLVTVTTTAVCTMAGPEMPSVEPSLCCHQSAGPGVWLWLAGHSLRLVTGSDISWGSWLNVSVVCLQRYHTWTSSGSCMQLVVGDRISIWDQNTCVINCIVQGETLQITSPSFTFLTFSSSAVLLWGQNARVIHLYWWRQSWAYYVHHSYNALWHADLVSKKRCQYFGKGAKRARRLVSALSNLTYKERFKNRFNYLETRSL